MVNSYVDEVNQIRMCSLMAEQCSMKTAAFYSNLHWALPSTQLSAVVYKLEDIWNLCTIGIV